MALIGNLKGPQGNAGAEGPQGPQGPLGPVGSQGPSGSSGADGAKWFNGAGAPSNGTGLAGDYYLNTANGDVYQKVGSSWT